MSLRSLLAPTGSVSLAAGLLVLGGCTSDLPAPSNFEVKEPPPPDNELALDCSDIPGTAEEASFDYTPGSSGQLEGVTYEFSATDLPPGLMIDANTGAISGTVVAATNSYDFDITIADTADPDNYSATTTCTLGVSPRLSAPLAIDTTPYCLQAGDDLRDLIVNGTGDGTPIRCDAPGGNGNGRRPAGIEVDPDTCTLTGSIDETRHGTWVFAMRGTQSGVSVHVPYCVTNDNPQDYMISASHSGEADATLLPIVRTYDPSQSFNVGTDGDPRFEIQSPGTCGGFCFFRYSFLRTNAPLETYTLMPDGLIEDPDGNQTGFFHELRVGGPPVEEAFRNRPWILSSAVSYCLSDQEDGCDDIEENGGGSYEFSLVMVPEGG